jgi:hypothetical protein
MTPAWRRPGRAAGTECCFVYTYPCSSRGCGTGTGDGSADGGDYP